MSNDSNISSEEQFMQFSKALEEALKGIAEVVQTEVVKINEVKTGLSIRYPGEDVSPTVYPEDILSRLAPGESPEMAAKACAEKLISLRGNGPKMSDIDLSLEGAKKNLYCVVINADANKELLKDVPHIKMEDLAVVLRYRVAEDASFLVHENHLSSFQLTSEEALAIGQNNTDAEGYTVQPMSEVLREIMVKQGMPEEIIDDTLSISENDAMYVVSNPSKVHGGYAIASKAAMEQAAEKLGTDDFTILPSSIHELILVPNREGMELKDLKDMVKEVNETQVEVGERLSDNIYRFNAQTKKISIINVEKLDKGPELIETMAKVSGRKM